MLVEDISKLSDKKEQVYRLRILQSLSLDTKILWAKQRIREWHSHYCGKVYVSFSGGKDSTVLLDIVWEEFPDVPAIFSDTGLEFPEIRDFVKTFGDKVRWLKPKMQFKDVIDKYGYPVISKQVAKAVKDIKRNPKSALAKLRLTGITSTGRTAKQYQIAKKWMYLLKAPFMIGDECCQVMKKSPFARYEKEMGSKPITGSMAIESQLRERSYLARGCNMFDNKRPISNPLSIWTEQDIFEYIIRKNLPYCSIYGEIKKSRHQWYCTGMKRTGCAFCLFGLAYEQKAYGVNKFQIMYTTHPHLWKYCMEELGIKEVMNFLGFPTKPEQTLGL